MVCETLLKIGETADEGMDEDEGDALFDEVEREWLEALGVVDGDDESTDDVNDSEGDEDDRYSSGDTDDEELIDEGKNELLDLFTLTGQGCFILLKIAYPST